MEFPGQFSVQINKLTSRGGKMPTDLTKIFFSAKHEVVGTAQSYAQGA